MLLCRGGEVPHCEANVARILSTKHATTYAHDAHRARIRHAHPTLSSPTLNTHLQRLTPLRHTMPPSARLVVTCQR